MINTHTKSLLRKTEASWLGPGSRTSRPEASRNASETGQDTQKADAGKWTASQDGKMKQNDTGNNMSNTDARRKDYWNETEAYELRGTSAEQLRTLQRRQERIIQALNSGELDTEYECYLAVKHLKHCAWLERTMDKHDIQPDKRVTEYLKEWPLYRVLLRTGYRKPDYGKTETHKEAERILKHWSETGRQQEQQQRIIAELEEAKRKGWYCTFSTLTLAPNHIRTQAKREEVIRDYVRRIRRDINRQLKRRLDDQTTLYYFCRPEEGKRNGRLHWHLILYMKQLPCRITDPNLRNARRHRREVKEMCRYWDYGFSQHIPLRYDGDAWSRIGWIMPLQKSGKPAKFASMNGIAHYVSKYTTKINPGKKWKHRTSMTRNLGLKTMPSMKNLTRRCLKMTRSLDWTTTSKYRLLKKCAEKELNARLKLKKWNIRKLTASIKSEPGIFGRLKTLIAETQESRQPNFTDILTPKLKTADISDTGLPAYLDLINLKPYTIGT